MSEANKQTLDDIARGALNEQFNNEFDKITANIYDPNTKATAKRKITITMTFSPSEDREMVTTMIETKSSIAPVLPTATTFFIGKDYATNKIIAEEYGKDQMKGQVKIEEITEDVEIIETDRVIDFQRKAK